LVAKNQLEPRLITTREFGETRLRGRLFLVFDRRT
jgi:hypothetical protein